MELNHNTGMPEMPKILMVNVPFAGHTNPTLGLAQQLVDKGCTVTYIHAPDWKERIEQTGAKFVPYDDFPLKINKNLLAYKAYGGAIRTVKRLGPSHDVLIYEMLFSPGKTLADNLGIPSIRLFSTFALNLSILKEYSKSGGMHFTSFGSIPLLYKAVSRFLCRKLGLKSDDIFKEITENGPELNYVYTTKDFQINSTIFQEKNYKFIGASIWKRDSVVEIPFEKMKKPLIYISLGTLLNNSLSFYKKCIQAFSGDNVSVIMSVGTKIDIKKLGKIPGNFYIYRFVPQLDVLSQADLFITHGGMNSVNEALYYSVPMIVVPMGNDQPTVAGRVEELKLGLVLDKKNISAEKLLNAFNKIHAEKQYLENAHKMKEAMVQAGGNQKAASDIINYITVRNFKNKMT